MSEPAAQSAAPDFLQIKYRSPYGLHTMEVCTVPYHPVTDLTFPDQYILRGAEIPVDLPTAVTDFVAVLRPFYQSDVVFELATQFKQDSPATPPYPVRSYVVDTIGEVTTTPRSWDKATQWTMTWRTEVFGYFKIVLLDALTDNVFNPLTLASGVSRLNDLSDYVTQNASFLAGRRLQGRPDTFLSCHKDLNSKLRRQYGM